MREIKSGRVDQFHGHGHYAIVILQEHGSFQKLTIESAEEADLIAAKATELAAQIRRDCQPAEEVHICSECGTPDCLGECIMSDMDHNN